jgi:hypothetical protein
MHNRSRLSDIQPCDRRLCVKRPQQLWGVQTPSEVGLITIECWRPFENSFPASSEIETRGHVFRPYIGLTIFKLQQLNIGDLIHKYIIYRLLMGKPEGKSPLGRPRRRRVDNIVTCMSVTIDGVWIDEQIYWPFTGLTTNNYNTIADFYTLQITTHFCPACSAFTSRCLVTSLNNGDCSTSVLTSSLSVEYPAFELSTSLQRPLFFRFPCRTQLTALTVLVITFPHGPHRKHRTYIVVCIFVVSGTCLLSCFPETVLVYLPISLQY